MGLKRIVFVCLGNICRSPAAEGVFLDLIKKNGVKDQFIVDSAGTSAAHEGERADSRMRAAAKKRGVDLPSISRQFRSPDDFEKFDIVIVMDQSNFKNIRSLDRSDQFASRVKMMTDFSEGYKGQDVPDPYYGGDSGFDLVLDILEDSCLGLMKEYT